jgi:hypothetical protein
MYIWPSVPVPNGQLYIGLVNHLLYSRPSGTGTKCPWTNCPFDQLPLWPTATSPSCSINAIDESYDILQYFFGQITYFRSVSFDCYVLFAFCNFVPWQMKFFCLLLYRFASRQHQQIFRHRQTKGDISNIADTDCKMFSIIGPCWWKIKAIVGHLQPSLIFACNSRSQTLK